jgi:glycerol-3-phosphate dehydrogenase
MADYDLAVIGGGINGVGIARDAAGRGLRVLLVEQNDLGSGTSSASTKLIHGGLRYLEQGAFRLVREALAEREVLLRMAPHIIRPLRFVLPHHGAMRPAWQLRLGLFIYDRLGGREILDGTQVIDLAHGKIGLPLKRQFKLAFEYSDCRVDDARLVVLNALDAAERGAMIRTRTRLTRADRDGQIWRLALNVRGNRELVTARILVNAGGPWVAEVTDRVLRLPGTVPVRLVKGSHIVVRRLYDHDRAYIFQGRDGRVVFAIPFQRDYTLIGTTDLDFHDHPGAVAATPEEIIYLCRAISVYLREPVEPQHVLWTFAGVRPLHGKAYTTAKDTPRDYVLALDAPRYLAPLLTVYGGKITTYRHLAAQALGKLARFIGGVAPWTHAAPLPGGDFPWDGVEALVARARGLWPFLAEREVRRLVAAYGTRIDQVVGPPSSVDTLGQRFGTELSAAEVRYLIRHEWAETAADVLWRRTKLGLEVGREDEAALAGFMAEAGGHKAAAE